MNVFYQKERIIEVINALPTMVLYDVVTHVKETRVEVPIEVANFIDASYRYVKWTDDVDE